MRVQRPPVIDCSALSKNM